MNDSTYIRPLTPADSLYIIPADEAAPAVLDTRLDTALIASRPAVEPVVPTPVATVAEQPAWMSGLEPEARVMQPGQNSGFLLVFALMAVVLIFNFKHLARLTKTYVEELTKVRKGRDNVFDERPAGDTRITILLVAMAVVSCGILMSTAICRGVAQPEPMALTGGRVVAAIAVAAIYYTVMLVAYSLVGYTFATPEGHHDLVRAYNASQALLGLLLVVPAMMTIFYPAITATVVLIALFIYLIARLLFILKGFRIFYTNIGSLVYFILYLCTLEFIPLIFAFICSLKLVAYTM